MRWIERRSSAGWFQLRAVAGELTRVKKSFRTFFNFVSQTKLNTKIWFWNPVQVVILKKKLFKIAHRWRENWDWTTNYKTLTDTRYANTLWLSSTNKQILDDRKWHLHTDLKFLSKTRARWVGDNGSQQQIISVQIEWLRNTEAPELFVLFFWSYDSEWIVDNKLTLMIFMRWVWFFTGVYSQCLGLNGVEPEVRWFAHLSTTVSGLELAGRVAQRLT